MGISLLSLFSWARRTQMDTGELGSIASLMGAGQLLTTLPAGLTGLTGGLGVLLGRRRLAIGLGWRLAGRLGRRGLLGCGLGCRLLGRGLGVRMGGGFRGWLGLVA